MIKISSIYCLSLFKSKNCNFLISLTKLKKINLNQKLPCKNSNKYNLELYLDQKKLDHFKFEDKTKITILVNSLIVEENIKNPFFEELSN